MARKLAGWVNSGPGIQNPVLCGALRTGRRNDKYLQVFYHEDYLDSGPLLLPTSGNVALLPDRSRSEEDILPCWSIRDYLYSDISDCDDDCILPAITRV